MSSRIHCPWIDHHPPSPPPHTHTHTYTETPSASSSEEDSNQMVNISLFSTNPDVLYSFPCIEMRETQETFPRYPRIILYCAKDLSLDNQSLFLPQPPAAHSRDPGGTS